MADYKKTKTKEKEEGTPIDVLPIEGAVDKKYIHEGFDSVEDFLCDMRKQYELDVEFDRFNREAAIDDKQFAAGEPWDPIVLQQRHGLPCLVINTIPLSTAKLPGDWRKPRTATK